MKRKFGTVNSDVITKLFSYIKSVKKVHFSVLKSISIDEINATH